MKIDCNKCVYKEKRCGLSPDGTCSHFDINCEICEHFECLCCTYGNDCPDFEFAEKNKIGEKDNE